MDRPIIEKPFDPLKMPGGDGLSLMRRLRAESHATVLMLTGMGSVLDRVMGLEMAADDYRGKPFEPVELRLRVKAVLRRAMAARRGGCGLGAVWWMSNKRRCQPGRVGRR